MLNQVATTNTVTLRITEQRFHHGKLMITREHLLIFCNAGVFVLLGDDLSIVFNDVGELILGQNFFPKIIRFDSIGVRRIACTIIESFVERQEPGFLRKPFGLLLQSQQYHWVPVPDGKEFRFRLKD